MSSDRRSLGRTLVVVGMLLVSACGSGAAQDQGVATSTTIVAVTTTEALPVTTTVQATTSTTEVAIDTSWFSVDLLVLESECFNTAGALVTVEPELWVEASAHGYGVSDPLPVDGRDFTVVYEVDGGEAVETFRLERHADGSYSYEEHQISTASCDYELSAEVVRVIERSLP